MRTKARTALHFPTPGLLPWEYAVAAFGLGILALKYPLPCAIAFLLMLWLRGSFSANALGSLVLCIVCAAGFGYANLQTPSIPQQHPSWMLERQTVTVSGTISHTEGRIGRRCRVFIPDATYELKNGESGNIPGFFLWDWQYPKERPLAGQQVTVHVRVRPARGYVNPGLWNTQDYWAHRGVLYRGYTTGNRGRPEVTGEGTPGARIRASLSDAIERSTPDGAGRGLLAALTMGDRFWLPQEVYKASQAASLAHSLALSGLHLGFAAAPGFALAWVVGWIIPAMFLRIPRLKLGILLAAPLVCASVWLGGATPSLVRAAIMFAAWGVLLLMGRSRVLIDGVFLAVGIILLITPLAAYDIRLQFSALAVAGIGLIHPLIWRHVPNFPDHGVLSFVWTWIRAGLGILLVSLCANIALFPLSLWNFGQVGMSLHLNVIWLPILGCIIMPLGIAGVLLECVPGLSFLADFLLGLDATLLQYAADSLGSLAQSGSLPVSVLMRPVWQHVLTFYLAIVLCFTFRRIPLRQWGVACAACLLLAASPFALKQLAKPALTIRALDVGQSQAILVELPGGTRFMVDGGGSSKRSFDIGSFVVTPTLTYNHWPTLDLAIYSHPDADHFRGLVHPLKHLQIGSFANNGRWPNGEEGQELRDILESRGIPQRSLKAGDVIDLESGYALQVLAPKGPYEHPGSNDSSLVLRLTRNGHGMALFPGDIEEDAIAALLATSADLYADLLFLPHHGSKTSISSELYSRVSPKLAIACTGYLNYLRFPSKETLRACEQAGFPVYDTGSYGQVQVTWDGNGPEVIWGR